MASMARLVSLTSLHFTSLHSLVVVGLKDSKITMWFTRADAPVSSDLWLVPEDEQRMLERQKYGFSGQ